ncbi:uncharacterized protein PSFLO_00089 [Pseudozyma flocculosa]|uniref:Uncharacterized protein n=2 Tax=Pseudozyma flocculosa TaxID=84751 RepID=A0A5C3EQZ1_9BASI|nr:uncharacterized protein PSFLO_00089 [Pseudozyma flocculosa]
MTAHLYKVAKSKNWFSENPAVASGVALRLAKGQYTLCPAADARLEAFYRSVAILNVEVAIKLTSPVVSAITSRLVPGTYQVPLTSSQHVQVVETMADLAGARKAQNACFIRTDNSLVAWCDHIDQLESSAQRLEDKMIAFVWSSATSGRPQGGKPRDSSFLEWSMQQRGQSMSQLNHASGTSTPIRAASVTHSSPFSDTNAVRPAGDATPGAASVATTATTGVADPEKGQAVSYQERSTNLQAPLQHGLSVALDIALCFLLLRQLFQESLLDGNWMRMLIGIAVIPMFPVILFFCGNIFTVILQLIGPVRQLSQNSRYYSGVAPERMTGRLPHITIQMPVYKESLDGVLIPTIESLKKAISTYELQGGTASIVVSEDGMQLISKEDQEVRREYYERQNIGWVSRPGHGVDGYIRKGRFKKASNLNFTCRVSLKVEEMMREQRPADLSQWTEADEEHLYQTCLPLAATEIHPLAQAEGNVRIGDLILMIDSDTRVPEDCFLDAASEMSQCPDVGVLQHCSGVMLVSDSYFERGIAFFTRLVNFSITYVVASGDVAPFMGHNAFLRWSAVQEASFVDAEDGIRKVWSESHVSEDFDMALRLLMKGYITRWATYSNNKFEEGVSLTCDDELNRWQKYAFGCSELVFNRLWEWPYKSPFTPLFRNFLWVKGIPIHYKFAACSYIFSYYAIAAALPLTAILYLVEGWFYPVLDPVFLTPFRIWLAVVFVFVIGGNVSQALCRYRSKQGGLLALAKEHIIWIPFMMTFFGGMSYHVLTALLSHPFGINMTWGATVKDLEDSNFFIEVPAIFRRFWKTLLLCTILLAGIVVLSLDNVVPLEWQIPSFFTIWPLILASSLHILYPIVLNPALLRFSF